MAAQGEPGCVHTPLLQALEPQQRGRNHDTCQQAIRRCVLVAMNPNNEASDGLVEASFSADLCREELDHLATLQRPLVSALQKRLSAEGDLVRAWRSHPVLATGVH